MGIWVRFLCAGSGIEWIDWIAFTVAIGRGTEKHSIEDWKTEVISKLSTHQHLRKRLQHLAQGEDNPSAWRMLSALSL